MIPIDCYGRVPVPGGCQFRYGYDVPSTMPQIVPVPVEMSHPIEKKVFNVCISGVVGRGVAPVVSFFPLVVWS
jgi:hypothetical protein